MNLQEHILFTNLEHIPKMHWNLLVEKKTIIPPSGFSSTTVILKIPTQLYKILTRNPDVNSRKKQVWSPQFFFLPNI
ncbi:hypothetical protein MIMGU_mgv1a017423mg [Erythranthe guttata]|uniref:Uncharacterized protein n=1 Tax=Erythranthe guttata TaxID=4155 RepID=A0A022R8Z3_ERYGU|nr:hypothetical protein MIMGU_mgv1a017423mg [Erythranthe guttata]